MPQPYAIFHYFKHPSYHRQEGQGTSDELRGRDFRRDLEERERTVRDKRDRNRGRISVGLLKMYYIWQCILFSTFGS